MSIIPSLQPRVWCASRFAFVTTSLMTLTSPLGVSETAHRVLTHSCVSFCIEVEKLYFSLFSMKPKKYAILFRSALGATSSDDTDNSLTLSFEVVIDSSLESSSAKPTNTDPVDVAGLITPRVAFPLVSVGRAKTTFGSTSFPSANPTFAALFVDVNMTIRSTRPHVRTS